MPPPSRALSGCIASPPLLLNSGGLGYNAGIAKGGKEHLERSKGAIEDGNSWHQAALITDQEIKIGIEGGKICVRDS